MQPKNDLPDSETCWALLERVASSTPLRRAVRLRDLLLYVGRCSLKEHRDKIHENEIGTAVFERPAGYDTNIDPIVRVNVTELRKRIEAYFSAEGLHENLIMEIPRGNYIPIFRLRPAEPEIAANIQTAIPIPRLESSEPIRDDRWTSHHRRRMPSGMTVAALLITVLAISSALYLWSQYRALHRLMYAWQYKPSIAGLWSEIFGANPDTDIVVSDASIGMAQAISRRAFPLRDYLNRSYISQLQAADLSSDTKAALNRILVWNLGSTDEFMLARRILALDPLGRSIKLYNAANYMPDLLKRDNVILIGARKSNPWDELFDSRLNFITDFNSPRVINRAPAAGEMQTYTHTDSVDYCVVAYMPNPDKNGVVLLIEGTGAEATEGAGDFLFSEEQLSNFKKMLHVNNFPYFEVLLKVTSVRSTPLTATIEAYRVYPNLH